MDKIISKELALKIVQRSRTVIDKISSSSTNKIYDPLINLEAVTPSEFKSSGKNLKIIYGFHKTPFGKCLIGLTERGICHLSFVIKNESENLDNLKNRWKSAKIIQNNEKTYKTIQKIFNKISKEPINLFLKGTKFQIKVWKTLIRIPPGHLLSYQDVAHYINNPKAVRAVSNAVANNPIAYIIPCHRVILKIGLTHKYRWGASRKMAMIGYEQAIYEDKSTTNP